MSVQYQAVLWNRQKRIYDSVLAALICSYLLVFGGVSALLRPQATIETVLIRGFGTAAFLMLHVVLCIGPLCRLDRRFLPLLYNRRHLGVSLFVLALAHGLFSIIQFHALGDASPLVSVLISNVRYDSLPDFPFQSLGLLALLILFLMAATSHDFWLHNLTPAAWKRLHMAVYLAYAFLVAHVTLGALQSETSPVFVAIAGLGLVVVLGLHLAAAWRERVVDERSVRATGEGFVEVCDVSNIPENRAVVVSLSGERVAVFRYDGKISAISNVCRHQNGPLGEGRIVDGCVTCPWHGYQYLPDSGTSPPPFNDKVPTYRTRVNAGKVLVHPCPMTPGTRVEPAHINGMEVEAKG